MCVCVSIVQKSHCTWSLYIYLFKVIFIYLYLSLCLHSYEYFMFVVYLLQWQLNFPLGVITFLWFWFWWCSNLHRKCTSYIFFPQFAYILHMLFFCCIYHVLFFFIVSMVYQWSFILLSVLHVNFIVQENMFV